MPWITINCRTTTAHLGRNSFILLKKSVNMKKLIILNALLSLSVGLFAQKTETSKQKKTVGQVINELPEMLIAQPEAEVDSNANRLINDKVSMVIPLLWKEKGLQTIIDFKLQKTDAEPILATLPLPEKKLAQAIIINSGTIKKTVADKKQAVISGVKNHLAAFYKEAQVSISSTDLSAKANAMLIGTEPFVTNTGLNGELFLFHDIDAKQSGLIILFVAPSPTDPAKSYFAQIIYLRYNYETTFPEDPLEWKMFVYDEEQQEYIQFTKNILKTLRVD